MSTRRLILRVAGAEGEYDVVLPGGFVIPRSRWNREAIAVEALVSVQLVDSATLGQEIAADLRKPHITYGEARGLGLLGKPEAT